MQKKKVYDIADSNIALLGSDVEKKVKEASAAGEPAWTNAGKKEGLEIWRIEKFKVVAWPKASYGQFYTGDSYICLNTYKDKENPTKFKFDVHFWLGCSTTQDEAGTAAYKTVELDTHLGGAPIQHREVEGKESGLFCSYFNSQGGIRLLEGGVESGFNHVKPTEYRPRLLHLKGRKNVRVVEVDLTGDSLNEGDAFILDAGLTLYQWHGKTAGVQEKTRAAQLARQLDDERKGAPKVVVIGQNEEPAEFWSLLGGKPATIAPDAGGDDAWEKKTEKILFQITDAGGKLEFNKIGEGSRVTRDKLESKDAYVLDAGVEVFVWIGAGASKAEKMNAMGLATKYLSDNRRPTWLPLTRLVEGGESDYFLGMFASSASSIAKSTPTAAAAASYGSGSGCYLTYTEASSGSLFLNWSHSPVEGALAYFQPTVKVADFKFKQAGGREELTRAVDSAPKNGYQAWCNFLKLAKEYKAPVTLFSHDVQIYVHDDKEKIYKLEIGTPFNLHVHDTPAVASMAKGKDIFEAISTTGRSHFLNQAQGVGAALALPKNK